MDLLKDIKEIVRNDKAHNLKIEVDKLRVRVLLDYDPHNEYEEKCIIPIEYSTLEEFAYIPDEDYREMYDAQDDYGLDLNEIELIRNIMYYLESHSSEIDELCEGFAHMYRNGDD